MVSNENFPFSSETVNFYQKEHMVHKKYVKICIANNYFFETFLPFFVTLTQHLAILYADFLFLIHQADRDWIASCVSRKCTSSFMNLTSSNDSFEFELILSLHFTQCQNSKMENQKSLSSFHKLFASKNKIFLAVQNKLQYYRFKKKRKRSNGNRKCQICKVSVFFFVKVLTLLIGFR